MMNKLKKFLIQIKVELLLVLIGMLLLGVVVLASVLHSKNKTVEGLRQQLVLKSAKLDLEKIRLRYNASAEDIKQIREKKEEVKKELEDLQTKYAARLADSMTAEQIADKFREIGL
jgi:predicted Holliday junction resolvase-like endonuclease